MAQDENKPATSASGPKLAAFLPLGLACLAVGLAVIWGLTRPPRATPPVPRPIGSPALEPGASPTGGSRVWKDAQEVAEAFAGMRVGNQTLPEVCEKHGGSSMGKCLERLAKKGFKPLPTAIVKDLSKGHAMEPMEIVQIMLLD